MRSFERHPAGSCSFEWLTVVFTYSLIVIYGACTHHKEIYAAVVIDCFCLFRHTGLCWAYTHQMKITFVKKRGGAVPSPVVRLLRQLGENISTARRSRQLSSQDMADRMGVDRGTLRRLEQGDPGVSINTLAMALVALGLESRLRDLVDPGQDEIGMLRRQGDLPKRVTRRRGSIFEGSVSSGSQLLSTAPRKSRKAAAQSEPEGW